MRVLHETSRRAVLAGISVAPAALMAATLPSAVLAGPVAPAADAALIEQAALVTRLSRIMDRAYERVGRKGDAVMMATSPRPIAPTMPCRCTTEEHPVDPASGIEQRLTVTFRKPSADHQEAERQHAKAMAAWKAEKARLQQEAGIADAGALCDSLSDQLADAVDRLIGMPAKGSAELAAKAGAFLVLVEALEGADEQETELARSLAKDVMRLGGMAAANAIGGAA